MNNNEYPFVGRNEGYYSRFYYCQFWLEHCVFCIKVPFQRRTKINKSTSMMSGIAQNRIVLSVMANE